MGLLLQDKKGGKPFLKRMERGSKRLTKREEKEIEVWFLEKYKDLGFDFILTIDPFHTELSFEISPSFTTSFRFHYHGDLKEILKGAPRDKWVEIIKWGIFSEVEKKKAVIKELKEVIKNSYFKAFAIKLKRTINFRKKLSLISDNLKGILKINKRINEKLEEIFGKNKIKRDAASLYSRGVIEDLKYGLFFEDSDFIYFPYSDPLEFYKKMERIKDLDGFIEEGIKTIKKDYKRLCDYYEGKIIDLD